MQFHAINTEFHFCNGGFLTLTNSSVSFSVSSMWHNNSIYNIYEPDFCAWTSMLIDTCGPLATEMTIPNLKHLLTIPKD